jgi:hypothetical protein
MLGSGRGSTCPRAVLSEAETRNLVTRHTFKGLASRGGTPLPFWYISREIGAPTNRWAGENRSGWSSPGYDELFVIGATLPADAAAAARLPLITPGAGSRFY